VAANNRLDATVVYEKMLAHNLAETHGHALKGLHQALARMIDSAT
jgi:hypothetical protein